MKFTINKSDIVDVLSQVQGLTGRRTNLAITECVLIKADEAAISLKATDLETCFEGTFPAVVESPGTIAISARKLYEIVREYPSPDILIDETDNRWINIGNEKVNYHLMGMNPDDFPETPVFEDVAVFDVPSAGFKRMIDKSVIISGIGEDKKPHINGILFERLTDQKPAGIRMVSTDGSRLSKYDMACAEDTAVPAGDSVLIPKKGLYEVSKFLGSTGTVQIGLQDSYFIVKSDRETLAIRLLQGQYPNYGEIVFRQDGYQIKIDKEEFHYMLKRMSILCTDSYRAAIFCFHDNLLSINATNPDIGESKEDMNIEYGGDKFEAAFNPRFFIEALNSIDDKSIVINIISNDKACLIEGFEEKAYLSAIMPMRV